MAPDEWESLPIAGLTALQALKNQGKIDSDYQVLINGSSGGVGLFAVQLPKNLGATVTGVCSSKKAELVRSLGASQVIDYNTEDYTDKRNMYDLVIDCVGNKSILKVKKTLKKFGIYIPISGPKNRYFGPMGHWLRSLIVFMPGSKNVKIFITERIAEDLERIGKLCEEKIIKAVVGNVYSLQEVAQAFKHMEEGHLDGKIIIANGRS